MSKLRRGRDAEGLGREEDAEGTQADVWGAELRAWSGGSHAEHHTSLISEKVKRGFQDFQLGLEIEIPISFGPSGPPNKPKSRGHGCEWEGEETDATLGGQRPLSVLLEVYLSRASVRLGHLHLVG